MGLRDKLRRLEKAAQGKLAHFELTNGQRYYFDPEEAFGVTFKYFTDSMRADWKREPRPEPPDVLKAVVAGAKDREKAFWAVYPKGITPWVPVEIDALVGRGELVPRALVPGRGVDEPRLDSEDVGREP